MPRPLTETERHLAMQIGDNLQKETPKEEKAELMSEREESGQSLFDRFNRFVDNIITPKGT